MQIVTYKINLNRLLKAWWHLGKLAYLLAQFIICILRRLNDLLPSVYQVRRVPFIP